MIMALASPLFCCSALNSLLSIEHWLLASRCGELLHEARADDWKYIGREFVLGGRSDESFGTQCFLRQREAGRFQKEYGS